MAGDRGRYSTRSKKVNGWVVREYIGSSIVGACAARLDAIDGPTGLHSGPRCGTNEGSLNAVAATVNTLDGLAARLAAPALPATGYYRHRGEWRTRRARPA
jgi:hypothetical protein